MTAPALVHTTRYGLAVHESGHATAFHILQLPFARVSIRPAGDRNGGVYAHRKPVEQHPLRYVIALLAGTIAESLLTGRTLDDVADSCGAIDFEIADRTCQGMDVGAASTLTLRAAQLVTRNIDTIRRVADVLIEENVLTSDEVAAIVNEPRPAHDTPAHTGLG